MLQLTNIRKSYTTGDFTQNALDDVTVAFRDSEFVAILGPSGSGKTTLLNIIGSLDHYDSGDMAIDSISTKNYTDSDWDAYRNNRIGFVFQSYNLIPHQTVLGNVELALTLSGIPENERRERARKVLEDVGLSEHINKRPNQLSGGQMQRVSIARALVNDPEILLADEPTGALDSKTSVQIMNLLTEIAKDRLVIMVTHNPDLADEYANRIITLADGRITSDSNPFIPTEADMHENTKEIRRTSMSFKTALGLSFNNLMTKKGRTIMTAVAGSIGIIGIAAILALANGVNQYIANVEEETLSEYPLQIASSGFDMNFATEQEDESDGNSSDSSSKSENEEETDEVRVNNILTNLMSSIGTNDLKSLKAYFDSGDSGIEDHVNAIEYKYNVIPQIYLDSKYGLRRVNPDNTFAAFGMGSGSSNALMSQLYSTDVFYEMPSDSSLYESQYEIVAGEWPNNYNECVLVLTKSGRISDYMLYSLGLRDPQEVTDMIKQFMDEEDVTAPEITDTYDYEDLLGITYKVVPSSSYYQYDSTYSVWVDKSDDEGFMRDLVSKGEDLKIVGIVKPAENQRMAMLYYGINYPTSLTTHLIEEASRAEIVQKQLADKDRNVITGNTFEDEEANGGGSFDMQNMLSIDENALSNAFQMDPSAMQVDESKIAEAIANAPLPDFPMPDESLFEGLDSITMDEATTHDIAAAAQALYGVYMASGSTDDFATWVSTSEELVPGTQFTPHQVFLGVIASATGLDEAAPALATLEERLTGYLASAVATYSQQLSAIVSAVTAQSVAEQMGSGLANAMKIDTSAFASAFQFNIDEDELAAIISSLSNTQTSSYPSNLAKLGYADLNEPSGIDIYPKSFEDKEEVISILDGYNDRMKAAGEDDKVITYTDLVGALMESVTDIVNMISAVLIAFVAISLVVSSIMIGVITYISVLERIKEIGILRAIGASKKDISHVFNAETIIEGFGAGVLGIVVTALLCIPANIIVDKIVDVPNIAILPWQGALALIAVSVFLTFLAGLIPSRSASRKDPAEALRAE